MSEIKWEVGAWYAPLSCPHMRAQVTRVNGDWAQVTRQGEDGKWVVRNWGPSMWPHVVKEEWGSCDECDTLYRLGSDDHDGENGLCWECAR